MWKLLLTMQLVSLGGIVMSKNLDENIKQLVDQALMKELKVKSLTVTIVKAEKVEWPSSSLGCSESGQYYLQVITPGYRIKANVNGKDFDVHTSLNSAVVCPGDKIKSAASSQMKGANLKIKAIQLAREKLLTEKNIDARSIRLVSINNQLWQKLENACGQFFAGSKSGYFVQLKHNNVLYGFYSDGILVTKCWNKESI